ncbi:MAG: type III secretion system cytoplasmic ring protein SctQ [Janthinobacterium lividum]
MSVAVVRRALPVLDRETAARLTRLARPRAPLSLPSGWSLEDAACAWPGGSGWCRAGLLLSGAPAALWCPRALAAAILDTLPAPADAAEDLLPLLLALALDPLLCALEAAGATSAAVLAVSRHADAPSLGTRALTLHAFGRRWPLLLAADDATLDAVLRPWPAVAQPADDVVLGATLRLGSTGLALGVLRGLGAGDVVLMQTRRGAGATGCLVVAGHLIAPAAWGARGWTLDGPPATGHANRKEWLGMSEPAQDGDADTAGHEDDIPVRLCFDLGRLDMTLGELRRLGPGAVLALPGPADAAISLTVGGRCLGQGELVEVAGHAGVRIVRILGRG